MAKRETISTTYEELYLRKKKRLNQLKKNRQDFNWYFMKEHTQ
jgi:hypothetical protein